MSHRCLIIAVLFAGLVVLGSCGPTETTPPKPQPSEARKKELLAANEILTACTAADIEKVKSLLQKNPALVNAQDDAGATPLARAVGGLRPSEALVKLLLEKGAKVEGSQNTARHRCSLRRCAATRKSLHCCWPTAPMFTRATTMATR